MSIELRRINDKALLDRCFETMPDVSENLWNKAKDSFKKYLFIYPKKNNSRECVCSVCGKRSRVNSVDILLTYGMFELLNARHNDKVRCPACGAECVAKSSGIRRSQLSEYHYFAFFIPLNFNDVWIRTFTVSRSFEKYDSYSKDYEYNDFPDYRITEVDRYHLQPRSADQWRSFYWNGKDFGLITGGFLEAFADKQGMFNSYPCYKMLFEGSVNDTFLKYSAYSEYRSFNTWYHQPVKYYAYYARYPLIEMLCKAPYKGGKQLVHALMIGDPNKRIVNWSAREYKDVFNMSPEELRLWISDGGDLADYKHVRRFGKYTKVNTEAARLMREHFNRYSYRDQQKIITKCKKYKVPFVKLLRYLISVRENNPGCSRCPAPDVYITWSDYIDNAEFLKYDLKDRVVFMPKNLFEAHDVAFRAADLLRQQELDKKFKGLFDKLTKTYGYEDENFIIVVPKTVSDIVKEGGHMHHCVGGYAERHFNGSTVILFLRQKANISSSFVTIEMNGKTVRQARAACNAPPSPEADAFIKKWVKHLNEPKKKAKNKESEVTVA